MMPDDLSDDQLLAYLDGDAEPDMVRRIEANPAYQPRLQALRAAQDELIHMLRPLKRPSSLTLGEYHLGLLPQAEARQVEAYLAQHPHAAHQLARLQDYLSEVDPFSEPVSPGPIERVKVLIAELIQAGGPGPQAALGGVRGDLAGIYQAANIRIVLETDVDLTDPSRKSLVGLVQGIEPDGLTAHLLSPSEAKPAGESPIDEFGNFMMSGLAAGTYHLVIQDAASSVEVHIQELQI